MALAEAPDKIEFKDEYFAVRTGADVNPQYTLWTLEGFMIGSIPAHVIDKSSGPQWREIFQAMLDNHFLSQRRGYAAGACEKAREIRQALEIDDGV